MKQFKKWLGCLLVICMVASAVPFTARAASNGTCGENVTWSFDEKGTLTVSGEGAMYDYYGTDTAPWNDFKDEILAIIITEGVTHIGYNTFSECVNVTSITIPESITSIDGSTFYGCMSLTSINIPESITSIGSDAFRDCSSLISINIPENLTSIGYCAFSGCSSLTEILVDDNNAVYSSDSYGVLFNKEKTMLIYAPGAINGVYSIPSQVTSIGDYAFERCVNLIGIEIPKEVTSFGNYAFYGCSGLTHIDIPDGIISISEGAFSDCNSLTSAEISDSVTSIGAFAFDGCNKLTSVTIPEGVTNIGYSAFGNCMSLSSVIFEGNMPTLDYTVFINDSITAYYPANNETWTADAMPEVYGDITWVPYEKTDEPNDDDIESIRISGLNRSQTAIAAADALKEKLGVEKFNAIILASGNDFADALAGSYLASTKSAPILLYSGNNSIKDNLAYIQANLANSGKVYILGGNAAVPENAESALVNAGFTIERLQGNDRFETNMKILEAAGVADKEILICTGWNYADCLSASATGLPILMVNANKNKLTAAQEEFLNKYKNHEFTIIGGSNAVSETLENAIKVIVGNVNRVYGSSREETSVAVADRYFKTPEYIFLTYSRNFPDGLCGGPLAYAYGAPLLLVASKQEYHAADYVKDHGIVKGYIMGGTAAVSEEIVQIVFNISE